MKIMFFTLFSIVFLITQLGAEEQLELKDPKDKVSYSIGISIGENLKKQSVDVNLKPLIQGIDDALSGSKQLMPEQEIKDTLTALQKEIMTKRIEQLEQIGEKNMKEGEAFLAENKKKEGVTTLPSGLQYKIIKEGTGEASPSLADTVTIHYRGSLINGTEFDSSYRREQPATFRVTGVIPGLTQALQLMKTGSKWQLFIPYDLAYGERGAGDTIGPKNTLIFEVELISFQEGPKFHTDEMQPNF